MMFTRGVAGREVSTCGDRLGSSPAPRVWSKVKGSSFFFCFFFSLSFSSSYFSQTWSLFDSFAIVLAKTMSGHHHHDHGAGGHCHDEGHDHSNDITPALQSLLYSQIQFDTVNTLNGMPCPSHDLTRQQLISCFVSCRVRSSCWGCYPSEDMG
jgi:hypothetical protein